MTSSQLQLTGACNTDCIVLVHRTDSRGRLFAACRFVVPNNACEEADNLMLEYL